MKQIKEERRQEKNRGHALNSRKREKEKIKNLEDQLKREKEKIKNQEDQLKLMLGGVRNIKEQIISLERTAIQALSGTSQQRKISNKQTTFNNVYS